MRPIDCNDLVQSAVVHAWAANLENLTLTGAAAILLAGTAAANTLTGGAGNDTLDGAGGNDVLVGGTGADSYVFGRGSSLEPARAALNTARLCSACSSCGCSDENVKFSALCRNASQRLLTAVFNTDSPISRWPHSASSTAFAPLRQQRRAALARPQRPSCFSRAGSTISIQ